METYDEFMKKRQKKAYSDEELQLFMDEMEKLITTNYELWDINEEEITKYAEEYVGQELIDRFPIKPKSNIQKLMKLMIDIGTTVAKQNNPVHKSKFAFETFFNEVKDLLRFDKTSDEELNYNGPDIKSVSITATSYGIYDTLSDIKGQISKYYRKHGEMAELVLLLGQTYKFAYGWANDIWYDEYMGRMLKFIEVSKKAKAEKTEIPKDTMDDLLGDKE